MTDLEKLQKALELIESIETEAYEMTKIGIELDIQTLMGYLDPTERERQILEHNKNLRDHDL